MEIASVPSLLLQSHPWPNPSPFHLSPSFPLLPLQPISHISPKYLALPFLFNLNQLNTSFSLSYLTKKEVSRPRKIPRNLLQLWNQSTTWLLLAVILSLPTIHFLRHGVFCGLLRKSSCSSLRRLTCLVLKLGTFCRLLMLRKRVSTMLSLFLQMGFSLFGPTLKLLPLREWILGMLSLSLCLLFGWIAVCV